jgi:hypothetical protein
LRVSISRLILGWHKPQVRSYRSAPFEAVGIFQGEHEGKCCKRSNPLDLAQEISLWIAHFGDLLQLSVVIADALCQGADLLQDGTQSRHEYLGYMLGRFVVEASGLRTWATFP